MSVLFCHGLESAPIGRKSQAMIDAGYEVRAPDGRGKGLVERVRDIRAALDEIDPPPVLVGSSFGGIAGLLAAQIADADGISLPALLLCAPALGYDVPPELGVRLGRPAATVVIHGTRDEVIPIEVSRNYCQEHDARLIEVDDDHSLVASLDVILETLAELHGPV